MTILLLLFFFSTTYSQLSTVINKTNYPFWINLPEDEACNVKNPLIIFLHGKSLSGSNIGKVKKYGIIRAIENGKKIPAIVIAPQLKNGSWNPDKVLEIIEYAQKNYKIDNQRIYVCGMSLGAYGTLHFAGKYPNKITAAVAICGGGNTSDAYNLSSVPLWIIHGDKDYIVPLSESKKVVDAVRHCEPKSNITFTVIKGGNHGNVEHLFRKNDIYDWMLKQVKNTNELGVKK